MSTGSSPTNSGAQMDRTKQLQNLWATSYDAWLRVPDHDEPVVYLRPQGQDEDPTCPDTNQQKRKLPSIVNKLCLFALTGYNPMGEDRDAATNQAANEKLREDLKRLSNPTPRYIWDSFGFAQDWREDGFIVAYDETRDAQAGEAAIIELAKTYQQGAIYGFFVATRDPNTGDAISLIRKTIPAAMNNVEADAVVVACDKPMGIKNADVDVE